jgi:hypothetical protein
LQSHREFWLADEASLLLLLGLGVTDIEIRIDRCVTVSAKLRSDLGVALLRAEDGEEVKDPQVSLKAAEDGRSTEAEAVVLTLTHDEALMVAVW